MPQAVFPLSELPDARLGDALSLRSNDPAQAPRTGRASLERERIPRLPGADGSSPISCSLLVWSLIGNVRARGSLLHISLDW